MTIKYRILCWLYHKLSKEDKQRFKKYIRWLERMDMMYGTLDKFITERRPLDYVYWLYSKND